MNRAHSRTSARGDRKPGARPSHEGAVIAVLAAVAAVGQVSTTIYLPSVPTMAERLGTPESLVQLTIVAYLVPFAFFQLLAGPFADSLGRRATLAFGVGVFAAGSLLGALSCHVSLLFVARFLQGVGASAGYTISRAMARDLFEGSQLTKVVGDIALVFAIAPGCMPLVGGFVNDWLGWRANFGISTGLGAVVLLGVLAFLPETLHAKKPLSRSRLSLAAYSPIARSGRFLAFTLLSTAPFIGLFAFFTSGPAYSINTLGLSPREFGMLPPLAVSGFLVGLRLSRRMLRGSYAGLTVAAGIGVGLLSAGLILGLHTAGLLGAAVLTVGMFLHATGMGFVIPVTSAEAIRPFGAAAGAASALLGFLQMAGAIVGTLLATLLGGELGRYAFPEVMFMGAVFGFVVLAASRRVFAAVDGGVSRVRGSDARGRA